MFWLVDDPLKKHTVAVIKERKMGRNKNMNERRGKLIFSHNQLTLQYEYYLHS
jgi:hypothetical protein